MRVRVVSSVTISAYNHHYSLFSVCAYFIQLYLLRAIRLTRHYNWRRGYYGSGRSNAGVQA